MNLSTVKFWMKAGIRALIPALLATSAPADAQRGERIQLEQLTTMFANMRAKAPWNVDGPLLWGYFFFDPSQEKLTRAAEQLKASGFRIVGIEQVDGVSMFRLHVERVETHTPASLNARNIELYRLADRLSIEAYDGMDVGPINPKTNDFKK